MKKKRNRRKAKNVFSKKKKLKQGKRLALSMANNATGYEKRIARLERITNKILDNIGAVGDYIQASEGRLKELEKSRWERFKNWLFGRKG